MRTNGVNLIPKSIGHPILNMIDEEIDPESKIKMINLQKFVDNNFSMSSNYHQNLYRSNAFNE